MEQTPETKSASEPESPAGATSAFVPMAASILRGLMRGAFFLGRGGIRLDDAMGKYLEAQHLKTEAKSRALALIGSGGILIAAFAPILNVPVVGAVTYFNGDSQLAVMGGLLLVILGIAALMFALVEKYLWLYPIGFSTVLIAIGTLLSWKWYQTHVRTASNAPPVGLLDYFTQSASKGIVGRSSLSFGLPLLIYGAVLVILAALLRPRALASINPGSPESPPD
jgi:hypothetical protein